MLLWIIFSVLTLAALAAVLWPLLNARRVVDTDSSQDTAVYRDQLDEIKADLARGLVGTAEAEAAKTEISRRILATAAPEGKGAPATDGDPSTGNTTKMAAVLVLLGLPGLSVALYLAFGSPSLPDQPFAARQSTPEVSKDIATLVKRVEERLRAHPEDGQGWDVIAPVYMRLRRYSDAAAAFKHAIRLQGEDTNRLVGYAEARVLANNGIVAEDAKRAFQKAIKKDGSLVKPHFWLGMAQEQDGKFEAAAKVWRGMLADAPEGVPWRRMVEERLKFAEAKIAGETPSVAVPANPAVQQSAPVAQQAAPAADEPGPSREDVAAAQKMTGQERGAMINQMVDGLAQRLQQNGNDLKGWLRLVRAYSVLGKQDKAAEALKTARENFKDNEKALTQLSELAGSLGL